MYAVQADRNGQDRFARFLVKTPGVAGGCRNALRAPVVVWCGGVAVWRCGGVAVWRCGGVAN